MGVAPAFRTGSASGSRLPGSLSRTPGRRVPSVSGRSLGPRAAAGFIARHTSPVSASAHLRQYADFSPRAKAEYRACMQEEGDLLRRHGYALAPPMPFEAVGAWVDAGMPPAAEVEEQLRPLVEAFDEAVEAAAG